MDAPQQFQEPGFLSWRRTFPWLHLLRVPGIAARIPILLVGFITSYLLVTIDVITLSITGSEHLPSFRELYYQWDQVFFEALSPNVTFYFWLQIVAGFSYSAYFWNLTFTLLVHLISGLLICRLAASIFTTGESTCLERSVIMSIQKFPSVFLSFLFPFLLIFFLGGLGYCCIASENIPQIGPWIAGILYAPAMLLFFLLIVFTLGVMLGWPLIIASLMIEDGDGFDAWSRSFDYIRSRLVSILFFFIICMGIGILIQTVVGELSQVTWNWLDRLVARVSGSTLVEVANRDHATFSEGASGFQNLWKTLWVCGVDGFLRSYYWVCVVGVYVLARYSVDRIPTTEFLVDDKKRPTT